MAKNKSLRLTRTERIILFSLLALSFVPSVGGTFRLIDMGMEEPLLPKNPRMEESPLPIAIHIVGSVFFCILGIFQFLPTIRKAYPRWHRLSGRVFIISGIVAGISGLWMTHFYQFSQQLQGNLLYWVRIAIGIAMIICIALGLSHALKRKFDSHQSWMIRAYALGQGAGMQVLTGILWSLFADEATGFARDLLMSASWAINMAIAEWIIFKTNSQVKIKPAPSL